MRSVYLVRYGLSGHVGRFAAELDPLERGCPVVVRTFRGLELGTVLAPARPAPDGAEPGPILRPADESDLHAARLAGAQRPRLFDACALVLRDGAWPIDLIDAEPLPPLDDQAPRVVVHYLGPHRLDTAALAAALRASAGLDVGFEPAGPDVPDQPEPEPEPASCGSGGCGSGSGGCGTDHGGCGSCAVKDLVRRRPSRVDALAAR